MGEGVAGERGAAEAIGRRRRRMMRRDGNFLLVERRGAAGTKGREAAFMWTMPPGTPPPGVIWF